MDIIINSENQSNIFGFVNNERLVNMQLGYSLNMNYENAHLYCQFQNPYSELTLFLSEELPGTFHAGYNSTFYGAIN